MKITVAIVQSGFSMGDYYNEETFNERIIGIFESIFSEDNARPDLVVFPELTGLWIPLLKGRKRATLASVTVSNVVNHPLHLLLSLLSGRKVSFPFYLDWKRNYDTWIGPFLYAARKYETYVCPGSMFLPGFDWEVARGWHSVGMDIYNTSCLINRKGTVLGFTRKVHLTGEERSLGIKPGEMCELDGYETSLGKIGILVCMDGFYEGAVEQMDRRGCRIIIQPSANPVRWELPPRKGAEISQEEEWLSLGLGKLIQGRENVLLSVNPMSVSNVLGHRDEGKSNVFVNLEPGSGRRVKLSGHRKLTGEWARFRGLSLLAESFDREEIIFFQAEFPSG